MMERLSQYAVVFLRIALGVTFLSSVADRFGMLGALGQPNVAWGTSITSAPTPPD